jgi:hypothetical protein
MNEKEAARLFASMGGRARAKKLSKKRRREIAMLGVQARREKRGTNNKPGFRSR